jgi:hypothetical protein
MDKQKESIYLPYRMVIEKITDEAPGVRTFRLKFKEEQEGETSTLKLDSLVNILHSAMENRLSV